MELSVIWSGGVDKAIARLGFALLVCGNKWK